MTIEELRERLQNIKDDQDAGWTDKEEDHQKADGALLKYINDKEVTRIYNSIDMWYA